MRISLRVRSRMLLPRSSAMPYSVTETEERGREDGNQSTPARPAGPPGVPAGRGFVRPRARRFSLGSSIPDGPLAFTSQHDPLPLTELEQMLVLTAAAGNTGWHYMIMRHARYAVDITRRHIKILLEHLLISVLYPLGPEISEYLCTLLYVDVRSHTSGPDYSYCSRLSRT
jgi:hypothetical protein